MYPVLFTIGPFEVQSYGVFLLLGFVVGIGWLVYEGYRRRWPKEELVPIALGAFVGGMLGARLSILFFNGLETAPQVLNFFALFDPRIGPGSILGGVAGGYIGGYIASKAIGKDSCACDAFAPALALAVSVGRIGNYLSAADGLGKPTEVPWGVALPDVDYLVHPTPLYDAGFNLIWFGVLLTLRDHPKMQDGNLLKLGLAGYLVFRFFVEFVRNNQILAFGLTGQQYFTVLALILLAVYYLRRWSQQRLEMAA